MHNRDIFWIFFNMKVSCMFSLESLHRGDSNEYTQYTIFDTKQKIAPKLSFISSCGIFSKGLKNEFEKAVVNGPSVFEPLKVECPITRLNSRFYTVRHTDLYILTLYICFIIIFVTI